VLRLSILLVDLRPRAGWELDRPGQPIPEEPVHPAEAQGEKSGVQEALYPILVTWPGAFWQVRAWLEPWIML
jgi:hypothetical protein